MRCVPVPVQAENAHNGRMLQDRLAELQERALAINEEEGLFGWERSDWPQVCMRLFVCTCLCMCVHVCL